MFRETPKYPRLFASLWPLEQNPLHKPQNAAAKFNSITLHPKSGCRKWDGCRGKRQQLHESKGIVGFRLWRSTTQMYLLTLIVITSIVRDVPPVTACVLKPQRRCIRGASASPKGTS